MGIFSGLFRSRDKPKDSYDSPSYSYFFGRTQAGERVNDRTAMQIIAVYACVRVLSEAIAQLPLHVYQYTDNGKERVPLCLACTASSSAGIFTRILLPFRLPCRRAMRKALTSISRALKCSRTSPTSWRNTLIRRTSRTIRTNGSKRLTHSPFTRCFRSSLNCGDSTWRHRQNVKKLRKTDRPMTTPLLLIRCKQLGLTMTELDMLTIGLINDMFTERENDDFEG